LVNFLPRSVILGTTVLLALLAWNRHLANRSAAAATEPVLAHAPALPVPRPAVRGEWLDLPESPMLRVRTDDVVLIRSAGNYSEIVANGRVHLVRATLTELASRFAPLGYVRVHRQTIVNARHVREICPEVGGRTIVHLYGGISVSLGGRYLDAMDALR
jgi:DNA-binding LytR/AlgR family response regulator